LTQTWSSLSVNSSVNSNLYGHSLSANPLDKKVEFVILLHKLVIRYIHDSVDYSIALDKILLPIAYNFGCSVDVK